MRSNTMLSNMMLCPVCTIELVTKERQGVEIDYCPQCRGIWLDRGELEKLIERSITMSSPEQRYRGELDYKQEYGGEYHESERKGKGNQERRSFLSELFDF